jgi:acyl CoA:acetate/3-ketoacid CoA transferase beta subunit
MRGKRMENALKKRTVFVWMEEKERKGQEGAGKKKEKVEKVEAEKEVVLAEAAEE